MFRIEIYIILDVLMSYGLLRDVYEGISAGKFIIKTKPKKIPVLYVILLILCACVTIFDISYYLRNNKIIINGILQGVFWAQICILNLLSNKALGLTEGGIYSGDPKFAYFTKWDRIRSYKWISDNVIQFEILGKGNKIINTDLEVDKDKAEEINNLLNEGMDKGKNQKRNFKLIAATVLVGIVMVIGYVNIIKISKPYMIKKVKLSEEEAIVVLKNTWKPLEELHKENIKSKEDFHKVFEETMSESMIDDLYIALVDKDKSVDGKIKFKEDTLIPTIYNTSESIKKAYVKLPKHEEEIMHVNIEELTIEEAFMPERDELSPHSRRKSTFIKNNDGNWILNSMNGLQSISQ